MKRIIIIASLTLIVSVFGSKALISLKEQVYFPLKDSTYLKSEQIVNEIKNGKFLSYDVSLPPVWNSKTINIAPPPYLLSEKLDEKNVLGDVSGNWIEVTLSTQTLCFHETNGQTPCFKISSGLPWTPTPTGEFKVWNKTPIQVMKGPGYYLPNVRYVMYFYYGYGTHEAWWHNNFGNPMSHGCINMKAEDAKYIYDRSEVGTLVKIKN